MNGYIQLTSAHIDEIDAAIAANADTDIAMLTREQFTLPTLSALLDQMRDAILRGAALHCCVRLAG